MLLKALGDGQLISLFLRGGNPTCTYYNPTWLWKDALISVVVTFCKGLDIPVIKNLAVILMFNI